MSQTIELKDEVFTKLKKTAEKDGLTPETWIEVIVEEKAKVLSLPKISEEEKMELRKFHEHTEKKLGEMWTQKLRGQITKSNE